MRPHKKRRVSPENLDCAETDPESNESGLRQLLLEEIDLEIAIRQRLADTLESRITWALLLQESLTNVTHVTGNSTDRTNGFQIAAMEALHDIDAPASLIVSGDVPSSEAQQSHSSRILLPEVPKDRPVHVSRPAVSRQNRGAVTKLLYISDMTSFPPGIAKMACPDCSRSDFTNIQGLLNHCRLRHNKDYGTHEECMQRCAVFVLEEDRGWVVAHGTELSGVSLPSLRRLFEIAVGDVGREVRLSGHKKTQNPPKNDDEEVSTSTHLSKTLGHHKDTPALAPFLGRAPKRRYIRDYDSIEPIDIGHTDFRVNSGKHDSWIMPYTHRNVARPGLDFIPESTLSHDSVVAQDLAIPLAPTLPNTSGTRFHIVARIVVADRSLFLPPGHRLPSHPSHTHRWGLSVDSPSYSLHITSFLTKMTVVCLTDPPPAGLKDSIAITQPPFVVEGTSDIPFLARLILELAGDRNSPIEVEHWVELDPFKATNSVLGDEQVLDVELDRGTKLLPIRTDYEARLWDQKIPEGVPRPVAPATPDLELPRYATLLKSLVHRVPMTVKDIKGQAVLSKSYMMVTTPAQFRNLLPGRRKAIEWGRARALREEYESHLASQANSNSENIHLTTGDVYHWLEDEGLFIRAPKITANNDPKNKAEMSIIKASSSPSPAVYCYLCGLNQQQHPGFIKTESPATESVCTLVHARLPRFPVVDISHVITSTLRSPLHGPQQNSISTPVPVAVCDLVSVAHPNMTIAIRHVVATLMLSSFDAHCLQTSGTATLTSFEKRKADIENHLAPYALMARLTQSFIGLLVRTGLESLDATRRDAAANSQLQDCVLTPFHIIQGLSNTTSSHDHLATQLCLARLGVPIEFSSVASPALEVASGMHRSTDTVELEKGQ